MKRLKKLLVIILVFSMFFTNQTYSFASSQEEDIDVDIDTDDGKTNNIEKLYEVQFDIDSKWENQYSGKITIKNISNENIENWKISFVTNDEIQNIWCAKIEEHNNDTYIVKNMGWNQDIKPGEEVSFGFIAKYEDTYDEPHNFYMSQTCIKVEKDYKIEYNIINEWENGLNGQISITNNSDKSIEDWRLLFNSNLKIDRFWTAEISHKEDTKYYIQNMGYNSNINPGETINLGFSAVKINSEKIEIDKFELYCIDVYREDTRDSDNDGLYDSVEISIGSDINKKDSDDDGLDDFYEVNILGTDPTKIDSDNNGIEDGFEDNDNDEVLNLKEYNLGTDPLNEDTDKDGVNDYVEIQLGLNPVLADTDNNGINDSEEMIEQTVFVELEENTVITGMSISMKTNEYLEDELFIDTDQENSLTQTGIIDNIIYIDSELVDINIPAYINFKYNKDIIECSPDELVIYEYDGEKFNALETIVDTQKMLISANVASLKSAYCVVQKNVDDSAIPVAYLKNNTTYTKKKLVKDIKELFYKEKKNTAKQRLYSVEETIDLVLKYDSEISAVSKQYGIKKEMIQAIIVREVMCKNALDIVADVAVENYYHNKTELEYYMSLSWWQQVLYGSPKYIYPQKEDASTGIGEIFAKTAILAREYNLKPGQKHYYYSNWKQRKVVWYSLKNNDKYSITMIAKILKKNAGGKSIKKPSKKTFQEVVALYNASTVKKGLAYGKMLYKYSKFLEKYNKNN